MRIKFLLTITSLTFVFLTTFPITRAHRTTLNFSNIADEFAQSSKPDQSKIPTEPVRKGKVDQELEEAAKRGEKVLALCFQDCESSSESLSGLEKGRALRLPKPKYPDSARLEHASGQVEVKVLIDEVGEVIAADAISGHPSLRDASVAAAMEALFSPTRIDGNAVKVTGVIRYNFVN